ncbi:MAG: DUF4173 domain-containing protein [Clostridia bacterium]|nr:DUF4173 domain-containing protein [Clostridia bacterium]
MNESPDYQNGAQKNDPKGPQNGAPAYNAYAYAPYRVPERIKREPLFQRGKRDVVIAAVLIVLSVLWGSSLFWDQLRAGYTIVYILSLAAISAFLICKGSKVTPFSLAVAALSAVCSLSFAFTSNLTVRFLSYIVTLISAAVWFSHLAGKKCGKSDFGVAKCAGLAVFHGIADIPQTLVDLFAKSKDPKSKTWLRILIGVGCAIPLLLILIPLLMSSDEAFSSLINNLSDAKEWLLKIIVGVIFCPLILGFVFSLKYNKRSGERSFGIKCVNSATVSAFLSVTSAVYAVYLFSQTAYFTSAFMNILPKGYKFTYAEYARRGFFELCAIAAINLALIVLLIIFTEKKEGKLPLCVKIPATFISFFTLVIIATAVSKMIMYINEYGMTVLRVCTSAFMLWMATVFIAATVRLFTKKLDILRTGLLSALIILSVLGVLNVNSFCARYNYEAYVEKGAAIDVEHYAALGDEGIEYLCKLAGAPDEDVAKKAKLILEYKVYYYYDIDYYAEGSYDDIPPERSFSGIGQFSFARQRAYEAFDEYVEKSGGFDAFTDHLN